MSTTTLPAFGRITWKDLSRLRGCNDRAAQRELTALRDTIGARPTWRDLASWAGTTLDELAAYLAGPAVRLNCV